MTGRYSGFGPFLFSLQPRPQFTFWAGQCTGADGAVIAGFAFGVLLMVATGAVDATIAKHAGVQSGEFKGLSLCREPSIG